MMKITHHLGRFSSFFKESSLVMQLVIIVSTIGIIAGTATAAAMVTTPTNNETSTNSTSTESSEVLGNTDSQPSTANNSEHINATPEDQTASESTASKSTQPTAQTTITTTQPTQTTTNATPQQATTMTPTPTAAPTCNESMKSSYTSLYNSQVNAENASWTNQITAWNNYASGHGMSFSGYVQDQINQNKPAHDARLTQLQTQYHQNLVSINCNP